MAQNDPRRGRPEQVEWAPRRAAPTDAAALTEVYRRSFRAALPGIRLAHTDDEIGWWMRELVIGQLETWLAEVDGRPAALLALGAFDHSVPSALEHLYVAPELRGRGLGDELVALAKRRRPEGLELWTFQANGPARRFYARHGFVEVELTDGAGNEEREPDARLVWLPVA